MSGIPHHAPPVRPVAARAPAAATAAFLASLACLAVGIAGCSSASSRAAASVLGSAVQQDCTAISDVLSDGPDPDADPAGYAQAQVLPLRQLKIADAALHRDVLTLAAAYQAFSTGTGAAAAVTKAENAVNSICPQAAP